MIGRFLFLSSILVLALGCKQGDEFRFDYDNDGHLDADDCAPENPEIYPGAPDPYGDGIDSDCDGSDGIDRDGDGYPANPEESGADYYDCNDNDPAINPGADEVPGDGVDNDCDGDETVDGDGDGFPPGVLDCDDGDPTVYWDAPELDDCVDNDCNGLVDELLDGSDDDGDGSCEGVDLGQGLICCEDGVVPGDCDDGDYTLHANDHDGDGYTTCDDDCDDWDDERYPGAVEQCDGVDNDCDLVLPADEEDGDGDGWTGCQGDCDDTNAALNPIDADGDGYSTCNNPMDCDDTDPALTPADDDLDGWTVCDGDCDDTDFFTWPGATEICGDCVDQACDGADALDCDDDGDGLADCQGDCDDGDATTFPGAPELCDSADNDCDGTVDEGVDVDGDGDLYTACEGDCDNGDHTVYPGAPEICDGQDNDCDGAAGPGEVDDDLDGWLVCDGSLTGGDCDDSDAWINPAAADLCDTVDNDCDGVPDDDCLTCDAWIPPDFPTLQAALDQSAPGDVVCVEPGTFIENIDHDGAAVTLVGVAGWTLTTIDGSSAPLPVATFDAGEAASSVLQGFTLSGGVAIDGGGIRVDGASPTLRKLHVTGNEATHDGGGIWIGSAGPLLDAVVVSSNGSDRAGGGVMIWEYSAPVLIDVSILDNEAVDAQQGGLDGHGGGVMLYDADASFERVTIAGNRGRNGAGFALNQGDVVMTDVLFEGNIATWNGGGLLLDSHSTVTSTRVTVHGNAATRGGGVSLATSFWSPSVGGWAVTWNMSTWEGGGIHVGAQEAQLEDVYVANNSAGQAGGGIYADSHGMLTIRNAVVEGNTAVFEGGGIAAGTIGDLVIENARIAGNASNWRGGGIDLNHDPNATLSNVIVVGNSTTGSGGGIGMEQCTVDTCHPSITNAVIAGNAASYNGGGIDATVCWDELEPGSCSVTITNTILADNFAGAQGGGIWTDEDSTTFVATDFWGNQPDDWGLYPDPTGGAGNLTVDPLLLDATAPDAADWDLHLGALSPLVDAGDPALSDPDGGAPDIGAYGGPGGGAWDLDLDGFPAWWQPGPYDAGTYPGLGWDCDDLDASIYPGGGC